MNQFLCKIYEDEHLFLPFSMKKKFPQAVARAILKQNRLIKDTWVVILVGITHKMMLALEVVINRHRAIEISDTNQTDKIGHWHVLVTKAAFKSVRKLLNSKILAWVSNLPDDMLKNTPSKFPEPKVYQKNNYEGNNNLSSGQASYMLSCAQSYGSFDNTIADEQYFNPPGHHMEP
jgi:hypothetical protein